MQSYDSVLDKIIRFRIHDLPFSDSQVHPRYDGYSIANLPDSICRWLAIPSLHDNPLAEAYHQGLDGPFQHVVFVLVDGLSLRLFQRFAEDISTGSGEYWLKWKSHLLSGRFLPLTSISPSTTSAALTTLWTGSEPCEHGIIGYELFLKEFGLIANMVTHSVASFISSPVNIIGAGFDPENFLPVDPLGYHYHQFDVDAFAFQHESIAHSGLSRMLFPKVKQISYKNLSDLWDLARGLLSNQKKKRFLYIYWSGLDTLSHRAGPDSEALYEEWCRFAQLLGNFIQLVRNASRPDTLLILTADHGQIATDVSAEYDLHNHPKLQSHLVMLPTGESRLPYLNIKPGSHDAVAEYLQTHWKGAFSLLPSADVLKSGLLGRRTAHCATKDRLGSHVVFPRGNAYWWWVNKENRLFGRHGGLSAEEMIIPFFGLPL